jgi:formiminotetrahydrofolate cyclodeaminase
MKAPAAADELLDLSVREFAERLADGRTAAGGGSTAAVVLAISAGLAGMAARASRDAWEDAPGAIAQADALRARVVPLVEADAKVYAEALETLRSRDELDPGERDEAIRKALSRAAEVPLAIAEAGCDVAELASTIAELGSEEVRGDAAAAAVLAAAGAQAAANLVVINLAAARSDERVALARLLVERSAACARRALGRGA